MQTCPSCFSPVNGTRAVCPSCGFNFDGGVVPPRYTQSEVALAPPKAATFKEFVLPWLLLLAGLVMTGGTSVWLYGGAGVATLLGQLVASCLIEIPLTLLSLYFAAKLLDISLGDVRTAVVKLLGQAFFMQGLYLLLLVFVGPLAAASVLGAFYVIALGIGLAAFAFWLFGYLFKLDIADTLFCLVVVLVLTSAIKTALAYVMA